MPVESGVGSTEDARALVPGDVAAMRATAAHLRALSTAFGRTAGGLAGADVGSWSGAAADAFRGRFGGAAGRWVAAAEAFGYAATAWEGYARVVEWAQGRAAEAAATGPALPPAADPGATAVERAGALLAEARRQRDAAGDEAARAIAAAAAAAPDPPAAWERIGAEAADGIDAGVTEGAHLMGGLAEGTIALVAAAGALNPADPRNAARPAAYVGTVSTAVAGLVTDVLHPVRALGAFVGPGWGSDPAAAAGRAIPRIAAAAAVGGVARSAVGRPTVPVPMGFTGPAEFARFGSRLHDGLARAGYPGTDAAMQGSSATGRSFRTGEGFDQGRTSDYDVALGGSELFDAARSAGIGLRSGGTRTGPLGAVDVEGLGLTGVREELMEMMGRKVEFMIYRDIADAFARSPSMGVPGP